MTNSSTAAETIASIEMEQKKPLNPTQQQVKAEIANTRRRIYAGRGHGTGIGMGVGIVLDPREMGRSVRRGLQEFDEDSDKVQ